MPRDLISAVARRNAWITAMLATALGLIASALVTMALAGYVAPAIALLAALVTFATAFAAAWYRTRGRRGSAATARQIERARPSRNIVITAEELRRHPERAAAWISDRIVADAAQATEGLRPDDVAGARGPLLLLLGGIAVCALAALSLGTGKGVTHVAATLREALRPDARSSGGGRFQVVVEPPAYSGREAATLDTPSRLDVLEGSRLTFELPAQGGWVVRFGRAVVPATFVATQSGYFAVEGPPPSAAHLIPLGVTRDREPVVRVEAPARDLLLPNAARTLAIEVAASDDLALSAMELRYTKVSGSGEQFEFEEGTAPLAIERTSQTEWRGRGSLALPQMKLEPGDSLVYRAVARDRRPGDAGNGTSDTYFVEIAGPGQIALDGVEMPPEMERYALSQQMVVQKIERLRAKEQGLAREAVVEEVSTIAAEQRAVRANFIFLMGGHVEDEEVEAEQSHEIQEGRLENTARREITQAIGHMTRAEQALVGVNTGAALPPAKQAVEALQRAFGRSRYLLRSLAVRSRLDPSRRLTGDVTSARAWRRTGTDAESNDGEAARDLLARLMKLASREERDADAGELQALVEAALAIDPDAPIWQEIAEALPKARGSRPALEALIARLSAEVRRTMLPRVTGAAVESPVSRAWRAERRQ